jgi:hypothetical protein
MLRRLGAVIVLLPALVAAVAVQAEQLYVYPAHGQTPQQTQQDEYQCYEFGKSETGFDPTTA